MRSRSTWLASANLTRSIDAGLARQGLGRAHHRTLYFIARKPDLTVSELLGLLGITKQSLGRVLGELFRVESGALPANRDAAVLAGHLQAANAARCARHDSLFDQPG